MALLVVTPSGRAEPLGPGTYHGYFDVTRWGDKVLHLGPYHLNVSDRAAQELEKHRSKPLRLKMSKISQNIKSGGTIQEIDEVSVDGIDDGLVLSVKLGSRKCSQGEGVTLHLTLRNVSENPITFSSGSLAVVLVTNSPFANKDFGYKDPNDCAFWHYQYGNVACRQIALPWEGKLMVGKGKKIHVADRHPIFHDLLMIEPSGEFSDDFVVGKELLPDDYEVFFYMATGNPSSIPGPMSSRVGFDVLPKKKEKGTAQPTNAIDR